MWTVACIYNLVPNMEYWPNIRPLGAWISGPLFQIKPWTTRRTARSYSHKLQYDFKQNRAISVGINIHSRTLLVVLSGIGDTIRKKCAWKSDNSVKAGQAGGIGGSFQEWAVKYQYKRVKSAVLIEQSGASWDSMSCMKRWLDTTNL